jgi:hypothetical protein
MKETENKNNDRQTGRIDKKLESIPANLRRKVDNPNTLTITDLRKLQTDFGFSDIEVRLILNI